MGDPLVFLSAIQTIALVFISVVILWIMIVYYKSKTPKTEEFWPTKYNTGNLGGQMQVPISAQSLGTWW